MTTSGVTAFDPSFAQVLDESFERAGIDPSTISHRHIASAKLSINLLFTEWSVRDADVLYRVTQDTETVTSGTSSFTPQAGTYDVDTLVMEYASDGKDLPIARISREDYLMLSNKDQTGRPSQYYVDQSTLNAPRVVLWPVPAATCVFTFDCLRYVQTPGRLSETMDVHRPWLDAMMAGLALRLAKKYNLPRVAMLDTEYRDAYAFARRAGSGNSQVILSGRSFGHPGRTRRGG
jgi:hypothetical protein